MYTVVLKHRTNRTNSTNSINLFTQGEQFYFNPASGDIVITDADLKCEEQDLIIDGLQRTYDYFPVGHVLTPEEYEKTPISKSSFTKEITSQWCLSKEFPFLTKSTNIIYTIPKGWASHEKSQRVVITVNKTEFCIHDFSKHPHGQTCNADK